MTDDTDRPLRDRSRRRRASRDHGDDRGSEGAPTERRRTDRSRSARTNGHDQPETTDPAPRERTNGHDRARPDGQATGERTNGHRAPEGYTDERAPAQRGRETESGARTNGHDERPRGRDTTRRRQPQGGDEDGHGVQAGKAAPLRASTTASPASSTDATPDTAPDSSARRDLERELLRLENAAGEIERPYLTTLPEALAGEELLFEWLSGLQETAGLKRAAEALEYYADVGWVDPDAGEALREYLLGLDHEPEAARDLDADDHLESLAYVARLARLAERETVN
jgi:archaellum component FlaD/FlaE